MGYISVLFYFTLLLCVNLLLTYNENVPDPQNIQTNTDLDISLVVVIVDSGRIPRTMQVRWTKASTAYDSERWRTVPVNGDDEQEQLKLTNGDDELKQ